MDDKLDRRAFSMVRTGVSFDHCCGWWRCCSRSRRPLSTDERSGERSTASFVAVTRYSLFRLLPAEELIMNLRVCSVVADRKRRLITGIGTTDVAWTLTCAWRSWSTLCLTQQNTREHVEHRTRRRCCKHQTTILSYRYSVLHTHIISLEKYHRCLCQKRI